MYHWLAVACLCALPFCRVESRSTVRNPQLRWTGSWAHNEQRRVLSSGSPAIVGITDLLGRLDKHRSAIALYRRLESIPVYIATDASRNALISHYPLEDVGNAAESATEAPPAAAVRPAKHMPKAQQIVQEFLQQFADVKEVVSTQSSTHDLSRMKRRIPAVVLYFMDPNACAAHVLELRRQGKEAHMARTTLADYARQVDNATRKFDPILLPTSEALVSATRRGKGTFKGTPIFTTDPPIVVTKSETSEGGFNPATDKLVVFFSPESAAEIYRGAWWKGSVKKELGGETVRYRILPGAGKWSTRILVSSLEELCARIKTDEPYWTSLIHLEPPTTAADKHAQQLFQESENKGKSAWDVLHSFRVFFNY
ncbi:glycosyltransferase involved in glycosylation of HMW1A and HMW2A, putative [Babesia ovata]|uniref:Glycosyltransferase involved in glycosylation of HMW1A and HMW2A, putative n=1 Tax=Babesia ovata TaxID=189622 RepID=A0A2H6KE75_9APIC|nr:glycosyltransferase involved in glycosylation of HMW1A and HMW2A, putative [Babesia ovata]GBE61259.1 glycosyltransferase involved in glycosylation of HMW1A and HMW2A, putative [Babesia ovata]